MPANVRAGSQSAASLLGEICDERGQVAPEVAVRKRAQRLFRAWIDRNGKRFGRSGASLFSTLHAWIVAQRTVMGRLLCPRLRAARVRDDSQPDLDLDVAA